MITLQKVKILIRKTLSETNYEQTEIFAVEKRLLEYILQLPTSSLFTLDKDTILTNEEEIKLNNCLKKLSTNMPLQYILKQTYFYKHVLHIDKGALIPRAETEELCDMVIKSIKDKTKSIRVLDACCGSGCIAYSLAYCLNKNSEVFALDISDEAIKIAEINFKQIPKDKATIHCIKENIFKKNLNLPQFDIIVSNPPYIMPKEKKEMSNNVKDFEPHIALFAPENDYTAFYKALGSLVKNGFLKRGGSLWVEINPLLYKETIKDISTTSNIKESSIEVLDDMSGKKRFIHLTNN